MRNRSILLVSLLVLLVLVTSIPALAQDVTEVRVWIAFTDGRLDWAREVASRFNEAHPEYNVVVDGYANYEEILDATVLALDQGNPPSVVQWFEVGTQPARDYGYFKPIATALNGRTEVLGEPVVLDDIIAPVAAYYTLDGVFTSMPWNSSSPILYANVAMLEAAGVEGIPSTWQEIEAACALVMAQPDAAGCITWPNHGWFFEQWMAQQDAAYANNDNGRTERATEVLINSEAGVTIAAWWQNMYNMGYYTYSGVQRDWGATEQAIETGTVPMIITSSADAGNITRVAGENGIEIVTARMPHNGDVEWTGNLIGGASLWLVDGLDTATEDGALAFMQFLNNTENAASWHQTTGYLPITNSAVALLEEQGWFEENPNFRVAFDQINDTTVTVATQGALLGTFPETRDLVTQAIEDLMLQGGDAAEVMTTAAEEANALLADYNALYAQ